MDGNSNNPNQENAEFGTGKVERLEARISELERELSHTKIDLESANRTINTKNMLLTNAEDFKKAREDKILNLEVENSELDATIGSQQTEINCLKRTIESKDDEITRTVRTIQGRNNRIKELENQIQQLLNDWGREVSNPRPTTYLQIENQTGRGSNHPPIPSESQEPISFGNVQNQSDQGTVNNNFLNWTHATIFLAIGMVIGFAGLGLGQIIFGKKKESEIKDLREKLQKTKN